MLRRRAASLLQRAWQAQPAGCTASGSAASAAGCSASAPWQVAAHRSFGQQLRHQHGGWHRDSRGYEHFAAPSTSVRTLLHNRGKVVAVIGGGAIIVWWSSRQEIPYTHRKHAVLLGLGSEQAMGESTFKQVLADARKKGQLVPPGHPAQQRVERIGRQIATAAGDGTGGGFHEHMQGLKWEFAVINSPELNAFVVPGGKVVVYAKMLDICRTDDELASVLAHETAHVLARHAAERVTEQGWIAVLQLLAYSALGFSLPSDLFAFALSLPHSRKQELEADQIGMDLAARTCFDPAAGKHVFWRLGQIEKQSGAAVPALLRTHPVSDARIRAIEAHLPKALQWAERSGCNARQQRFFDIFSALEPPAAAVAPAQ